jgi:hypothetical protein
MPHTVLSRIEIRLIGQHPLSKVVRLVDRCLERHKIEREEKGAAVG